MHVYRRTRNTEVKRGSKRAEGFCFLNWFSVIRNTWKRWCWIIGKQPSSSSFFSSIFLLGSLCTHKTGIGIKFHLQDYNWSNLANIQLPLPAINRLLRLPFRDFLPPLSIHVSWVYDDRDRADDLSCTVTPCRRSVGQIREYRSWILWKYVVFIQIPICQDCAWYSPYYFSSETITLLTPLMFLA